MPLTGENRTMVWRGLQALANPKRVGLAALMAECGALQPAHHGRDHRLYLSPAESTPPGAWDDVEIATELFLTNDAARAVDLASAAVQAQPQAAGCGERHLPVRRLPCSRQERPPKAIVLADETWHQGVVGIVASRLGRGIQLPDIPDLPRRRQGQGVLPLVRRVQPVFLAGAGIGLAGKLRRARACRGLYHPA